MARAHYINVVLGLTIIALFFCVPLKYVFVLSGPAGIVLAAFLDALAFGFIGSIHGGSRSAEKRARLPKNP